MKISKFILSAAIASFAICSFAQEKSTPGADVKPPHKEMTEGSNHRQGPQGLRRGPPFEADAMQSPKKATEETNDRQGPNGLRRGPPPEAITACAAKAEGTACTFTGKSKQARTGSCATHPEGNKPMACKSQF